MFRAVSVLWQNRKRPSHRAKEVTRKSYFCPMPRQSVVCLSQRQRGHAEIILCHSAICQARARPPRHTPSATTRLSKRPRKPARFSIFRTPSTCQLWVASPYFISFTEFFRVGDYAKSRWQTYPASPQGYVSAYQRGVFRKKGGQGIAVFWGGAVFGLSRRGWCIGAFACVGFWAQAPFLRLRFSVHSWRGWCIGRGAKQGVNLASTHQKSAKI